MAPQLSKKHTRYLPPMCFHWHPIPRAHFWVSRISDNYINGRHRLPSCAPLTRLVFRSSLQFSLSPILSSDFQRKRNPAKAYRDVVWTTVKVSHCWCPQTLFPSEVFISPFPPLFLYFPQSTVLEPERRDCNVMTGMIILLKSSEATLGGPKICKKSPRAEEIWLF